MTKYRIKRITSVNGLFQYNTVYIIQKKILFWFFRIKIPTIYDTYNDYGRTCSIKKTTICTKDKDKAIHYLEELKHPFKEKYRGYTIVQIEGLYVNKNLIINPKMRFYSCSYDLSELHKQIDIIKDKPKTEYKY